MPNQFSVSIAHHMLVSPLGFRLFDSVKSALQSAAGLIVASLLLNCTVCFGTQTQQLHISVDGHFLSEASGRPFFWLGDTAWPLFVRLTHDEADSYLRDRAEKGFTVIQAVILCGPWDKLDVANRYGALPLIHKDLAHPNPRYFDNVDWIVDRATHYGLHMALLPLFAVTWLSDLDGCGAGRKLNMHDARVYGRWLGRRYRDKGVIWILGGDTNPMRPAYQNVTEDAEGRFFLNVRQSDLTIIDYRPIFDAMAKGLTEGDGGKPLITYHPSDGSFSGTAPPRMSLYFGDRDWYGLYMFQSGHNLTPAYEILPFAGYDFSWSAPFNYEVVTAEYNAEPVRPVIDGESRYEGEPVDIIFNDSKGLWSAYDARNAAYHAVFAGAAGHTFGNNSVHQLYDPAHGLPLEHVEKPWQIELQSEAAVQMRYLKELMLSRPYFSRIPDQSIIVGDSGLGIAHVAGTRSKEGSYAMVYVPQQRVVSIDMSKIAGLRALAWWFDPRTGRANKIEGSFQTTGVASFASPSGFVGPDWVLVLDDESRQFPAPGSG